MDTEVLRADSEPRRGVPGPVTWTLPDVACVLFGWLAATVLIGLLADGRPRDPLQGALVLFAPHLVLGVLTLLWVRARSEDGIRRLVGERPSIQDVGTGLIYGVIGAVVLTFGVGLLLRVLLDALHLRVPLVQQAPRELVAGSAAPLAILLIVAVAPIAEELFFRGMLFQAFERWLCVWPSAVVSAGVFAVPHAEPSLLASAIVAVPVFLFGVYLALIFRRRGTIITPIIAHMLFNGLGVLLIRAGLG